MSEGEDLDTLLLLLGSSDTQSAYKGFLLLANSAGKRKLVNDYLQVSPICHELFDWWDNSFTGKVKPPKGMEFGFTAAILDALGNVIRFADPVKYDGSKKVLTKKLLNDKLKGFHSFLTNARDSKMVTIVLKLLINIVNQGTSTTREASHKLNLSSNDFLKHAERVGMGSVKDVNVEFRYGHTRHRFIQLTMAFLENADVTVKKKLLEPRGLVLAVFRRINSDPVDVLEKFFQVLRSKVLLDHSLGRKAKLHMFQHVLAEKLVPLYDSPLAGVRDVVHKFLLDLLVNPDTMITVVGNSKNDDSIALEAGGEYGTLQDRLIAQVDLSQKCCTKVLSALRPVRDELQEELLLKLLRNDPNLIEIYFAKGMNHAINLDPRPSFPWVQTIVLMSKILMDLPQVPADLLEKRVIDHLSKTSTEIDWDEICDVLIDISMPNNKVLSRQLLTKGLQHESPLVVVHICDLMIHCLWRLNETLQLTVGRCSKLLAVETHDELVTDLKQHFGTRLVQKFPDVKLLIGFLSKKATANEWSDKEAEWVYIRIARCMLWYVRSIRLTIPLDITKWLTQPDQPCGILDLSLIQCIPYVSAINWIDGTHFLTLLVLRTKFANVGNVDDIVSTVLLNMASMDVDEESKIHANAWVAMCQGLEEAKFINEVIVTSLQRECPNDIQLGDFLLQIALELVNGSVVHVVAGVLVSLLHNLRDVTFIRSQEIVDKVLTNLPGVGYDLMKYASFTLGMDVAFPSSKKAASGASSMPLMMMINNDDEGHYRREKNVNGPEFSLRCSNLGAPNGRLGFESCNEMELCFAHALAAPSGSATGEDGKQKISMFSPSLGKLKPLYVDKLFHLASECAVSRTRVAVRLIYRVLLGLCKNINMNHATSKSDVSICFDLISLLIERDPNSVEELSLLSLRSKDDVFVSCEAWFLQNVVRIIDLAVSRGVTVGTPFVNELITQYASQHKSESMATVLICCRRSLRVLRSSLSPVTFAVLKQPRDAQRALQLYCLRLSSPTESVFERLLSLYGDDLLYNVDDLDNLFYSMCKDVIFMREVFPDVHRGLAHFLGGTKGKSNRQKELIRHLNRPSKTASKILGLLARIEPGFASRVWKKCIEPHLTNNKKNSKGNKDGFVNLDLLTGCAAGLNGEIDWDRVLRQLAPTYLTDDEQLLLLQEIMENVNFSPLLNAQKIIIESFFGDDGQFLGRAKHISLICAENINKEALLSRLDNVKLSTLFEYLLRCSDDTENTALQRLCHAVESKSLTAEFSSSFLELVELDLARGENQAKLVILFESGILKRPVSFAESFRQSLDEDRVVLCVDFTKLWCILAEDYSQILCIDEKWYSWLVSKYNGTMSEIDCVIRRLIELFHEVGSMDVDGSPWLTKGKVETQLSLPRNVYNDLTNQELVRHSIIMLVIKEHLSWAIEDDIPYRDSYGKSFPRFRSLHPTSMNSYCTTSVEEPPSMPLQKGKKRKWNQNEETYEELSGDITNLSTSHKKKRENIMIEEVDEGDDNELASVSSGKSSASSSTSSNSSEEDDDDDAMMMVDEEEDDQVKIESKANTYDENVLDPSFYLNVLARLIEMYSIIAKLPSGQDKVTGDRGDEKDETEDDPENDLIAYTFPARKWIEVGALGYVVFALSSSCRDVRLKASMILQRYGQLAMREKLFRENIQVLLLLRSLRNTFETSGTLVCPLICSFLVQSLEVLIRPNHPMYAMVNVFFVKRPAMDLHDLPLVYDAFNSGSPRYIQERGWFIRFVVDGICTKQDVDILVRRNVFNMMMSFCNSALVDLYMKENIIKVCLRTAESGLFGVRQMLKTGILNWIVQSFQFHVPNRLTNRDVVVVESLCRLLFVVLGSIYEQKTKNQQQQQKFDGELMLAGLSIIRHVGEFLPFVPQARCSVLKSLEYIMKMTHLQLASSTLSRFLQLLLREGNMLDQDERDILARLIIKAQLIRSQDAEDNRTAAEIYKFILTELVLCPNRVIRGDLLMELVSTLEMFHDVEFPEKRSYLEALSAGFFHSMVDREKLLAKLKEIM